MTLLLSVSFVARAQFLLNGSVGYSPYAGLQPELIKGVSGLTADSFPRIRHVYLVNDTILGITIDAQAVARTGLLAYYHQPGDSVVLAGPKIPVHLASIAGLKDFIDATGQDSMVSVVRYVYRNGKPLGWLVGKNHTQYWPVEKVMGNPLNTAAVSVTSNYTIAALENNKLAWQINPKAIYRKSKPHVQARQGPLYEHSFAQRHEVYLVLGQPFVEGKKYTVSFNNSLQYLGQASFTVNTRQLRTEAIHVSLAGYHPMQEPKLAYLSMWLGDGGKVTYANRLPFYVIDSQTKEIAFKGETYLSLNADSVFNYSEYFGPDNYNKTHVYGLDFSGLKTPGNYQVYVPNIGVSFVFSINDQVFANAFKLQMKGFFHQRSGIEMQMPYTSYNRPKNGHPATGTKIYTCNKDIFLATGTMEKLHTTTLLRE
ncbi:MAG: hypothetical protein HC896_03815 [Bacteroidales bacterium]|nr:hypothetical protein [Bacteroidales bacterium]